MQFHITHSQKYTIKIKKLSTGTSTGHKHKDTSFTSLLINLKLNIKTKHDITT